MVAFQVSVAEECINALIANGSVSGNSASCGHMLQEETIGRLLFAVVGHPDHDFLGASLIHTKHHLLVPMSFSADKSLIHLHKTLKRRAFIDEMVSKASEPASDSDMRESGDFLRGVEGCLLLPTDQEQPEFAKANLHRREPRSTGETKGVTTSWTAIALLRTTDMRAAAVWTEGTFAKGGFEDDAADLGVRRRRLYDIHRNSLLNEGATSF